MYAVEFEASIDKGVVRIPARYEKIQNSNHAKIIIRVDELGEGKDGLALQQFISQGKKVGKWHLTAPNCMADKVLSIPTFLFLQVLVVGFGPP